VFGIILPFVSVMLNFLKLPIDIYPVIHQYLLNYDYHEFLNTSKAVFSEVKYRTMHYHLRYSAPFDQVDVRIISDIVTSGVMNKRAQIFITFKFDCRTYEASVGNSARMNLQIPIDVRSLKLEGCYHPDNLCFTGGEGGYLHALEICGKNENEVEYDFSSVSATFPFLRKLVVKHCRIVSARPLLHIPHIKLSGVLLPGMETAGGLSSDFEDVNLHHSYFHYDTWWSSTPLISTLSSFKDVQNLSLIADFVSSNSSPGYSLSCQSLSLSSEDRPACFPFHLKKPQKLSFHHFDLKMLMIDNITELEEVCLLGCSNVDMTLFRYAKKVKIVRAKIDLGSAVKTSDLISFQFLSHIMLAWCGIVDVSLFSNVRSVELEGCANLTSLEGLGKSTDRRKGNHHVTVAVCPGISDFSPLNGLHRVRIHNCIGFSDGNQVKDVINLTISCCCYLESFHMFGKVHSLQIDRCRHLKTLFGLQDIPYLRVLSCENLKEIEGLKNNQYVEIQNCTLLNRERKYYITFFSFLPHFSITGTS
jgi:hypothetical protein